MMKIVVGLVVVAVIIVITVHVSDIFTCYECYGNIHGILATIGGELETRGASLSIIAGFGDRN